MIQHLTLSPPPVRRVLELILRPLHEPRRDFVETIRAGAEYRFGPA